MVDFYEVHGKQLEAAKGRIRRGECWSVALREPVTISLTVPPPPNEQTVKIVRFVAASDNTLKPATELDLAEIMDWNRRHKRTPVSHFGLPTIPPT